MLTIGHSTLASSLFLRILAANGIATLVDIRTIPQSRHNPQFGREALSAALAAQSIEYHWLPSLGGLRKPLKAMAGIVPLNAGWRNSSFRGYADYMQTAAFAAALDDLLRLAPHATTAILCAEAVPWRCHRSLVSDALVARGIPVEHILYDSHGISQRKAHQLIPFARIEGTRVWYPAQDGLFEEET